MIGTDNGTEILGYGGNDLIDANGGDDFLFSGDEDTNVPRGTNANLGASDTLFGGFGQDTLQGDDGDVFNGGDG